MPTGSIGCNAMGNILHVLHAIRSGVVVWSDDAPKGTALLFLRGAPAVIKDLVQPESVPEDFNQVSPMCFDIYRQPLIVSVVLKHQDVHQSKTGTAGTHVPVKIFLHVPAGNAMRAS